VPFEFLLLFVFVNKRYFYNPHEIIAIGNFSAFNAIYNDFVVCEIDLFGNCSIAATMIIVIPFGLV